MLNAHSSENPEIREVYQKTRILRKPISGIVSGYHEVPYCLIAPDEENLRHAVEVNGTIHVSPKFVISSQALQESFGEVFDPETFNEDIKGRLFSFAVARRSNMRIENKNFSIQNFAESADDRIDKAHDRLLRQENVRTALVFGPRFSYYPVSVDRLISEIVDREFRV